jgi:hypothetical protein
MDFRTQNPLPQETTFPSLKLYDQKNFEQHSKSCQHAQYETEAFTNFINSNNLSPSPLKPENLFESLQSGIILS